MLWIWPSRLRRRLAALGCILIGLPSLYGLPPLIAAPQNPALFLRVDLRDAGRWLVEWTERGDATARGDWPAQPFWREGLAQIERSWPEAQRQAALDNAPPAWLSDGAADPAVAVRRGSFHLWPVAPGEGFDQSFAFPALASGTRLDIEIVGIAPGLAVEFAGLENVETPNSEGILRLFASARHRVPQNDTGLGPLRLHLSSHRDAAALARAILAPYGPSGDVAVPQSLTQPDPAALRALMLALAQRPANPGTANGIAAPILGEAPIFAALAQAMRLQAELLRHGWDSSLVLGNRRPLLALPIQPVFLFDTVVLDVPAAGILLDPARGMVLDRNVPHPDLAGKAAFVLANGELHATTFRALVPSDNQIRVRAELALDHDGVIAGHSRTEARGAARPLLEQLIGKLTKHPTGMADLMGRQGFVGTARLGPRETDADSLSQHLEFELAKPASGTAPMPIHAGAGPRLFRPPLASLLPALQSGTEMPLACVPIRLEQDIVMHLPDRRSLLDVPPDLRVEAVHARYEASYRLDPPHLHIRRHLELDPPGALCSSELIREMAPVLRAAGRDFDRPLNLRRAP